jgi:hypothetical protein
MKEIEMDKYKQLWNNEKGFDKKILSDREISGYLRKRSRSITGSFRIGLLIDIVLKVLLGISFLILALLLADNATIQILCGIMFLLLCYLFFLQIRTYIRLPGKFEYTDNIKGFLEGIIRFYRTRFIRSLHLTGLSNPLLFISGMFYYFWLRYETIRSMDAVDFFVLGIFCLAGYLLGFMAHRWQYNYRIRQMEECLNELNEGGIQEQTLKRQARQNTIFLILFISALVIGLIALSIVLTMTN